MGSKTRTSYHPDHDSPRMSGQLHWYHWLIVAASLLLTFGAWYITSTQAQQKAESNFNYQASQIIQLVKERMAKYEEALWAGVAAMHVMPPSAGRKEWRLFASSLNVESRFPGINGIGLIHYLSSENLSGYLARQRQEMESFRIHPLRQAEEFWPISYIEPQEPNIRAVGLDVAHEKNRYTGAVRARDSGLAQITGPIILVQDEKKTPGFLFFAPWYGDDFDFDAKAAKSRLFLGLVYAPFIMHKLMDGTLANSNRQVNFSIYDGAEELYNELTVDSQNFDPDPMFSQIVIVKLYGRTWKFSVQSSSLFRVHQSNSQPKLILVGGLAIDALLFALFLVLARTNKRSVQYASEVTEDLREQKIQLTHAHLRLTSAMDAMLDGLVVVDDDGIILECNNAILAMLRYSKEQLIGENIRCFLPFFGSATCADMQAQPSSGIIDADSKLRALRVDGKEIPVKLSVTQGATESGVFYTGIIHDLTVITETQWHMEENERLLNAAIHATPAGFAMSDSQQKFIEVNLALAQWLGYVPTEMMGMRFVEILPERDRHEVQFLLDALLDSMDETVSLEQQFKCKDGSILWGFFTAAVVRKKTEEVGCLVVQVIDVDFQKKLANDLEIRNAALEDANRELDQFAFVASHDLKAPLRGIMQLAQWVEGDLAEKLDPETGEYLRLMRNRIERLERLLDDLLEYSRVSRQDGKMDIVNIADMVQENFLLLNPPVDFSLQCYDEIGEFRTLITPLELVVRNLLSNALKHHDNSRGVLSVSSKISSEGYLFSVTDDGPGIPREHHERVFRIFHTLKPRDQVEGSGMGMAIIKKILDRYHCNYELLSGNGRGTTFNFTWPTEAQLSKYLSE